MQLIIKHLASRDEVLKSIIDQLEYLPVPSTGHLFHDLMSCVIEQQIHYRSTKKLFEKLLTTAKITLLTPENFHRFEEKALPNVKLSARKYETINEVLHFFNENPRTDWLQKEEKEIRKMIGGIKGVGIWTVEMLLLYTFQHPNVFPADDYHLKMMMEKLYPLDTSTSKKAQLKAIAKHWEPYRSYGVKYLLAWKKAQR